MTTRYTDDRTPGMFRCLCGHMMSQHSDPPELWCPGAEPQQMEGQEALFPTEPRSLARTDDPDTSKASAAQTAPNVNSQVIALLVEAYGPAGRPITDREAGELALSVHPRDITKRCADARRKGVIARTGKVLDPTTGRHAMVCEITPEGEQLLKGQQ